MDNQHTQDYLNYYLGLKTEPHYAILLKGAWGSGKTWFLEEVLSEYGATNPDFKFLKVSLYGINTVEQIEEEFYRQLHPVLSNKALIFGAKVLKNTLKASLKIDLDGDAKSELNINAGIPTVNIKAFVREPNGFVLVFDDIERTGIDLGHLFGYINHFVEVNGYKAILIANEEEILSREMLSHAAEAGTRTDYERKKEKLVGRTFEVASDFNSACKVFLGELKSSAIASVFKNDIRSVEALYNAAGFNNLRHLRQFFLDVDRIAPLLGDKYIRNDEFLALFFQQLLIFSMEYRGGRFTREDFIYIGRINYSLMVGRENEETNYEKTVKKYPALALKETLLTGEDWRDLICDGKVTDAQRRRLDVTRFFRDANTQAWEYLWSYPQLSEPVLREKHAIAKDSLFSGHITEMGELLMTASILIDIANEGLTEDAVEDIIDATTRQIDTYYNSMEPEAVHAAYARARHDELTGWRGLGFRDREGVSFRIIQDRVIAARQKRFDASLPEFARKLSEQLKSGNFTFLWELSLSEKTDLKLYDIAFLHLIDPGTFIDSYRQLDPYVMSNVSFSLKNRYDEARSRASLREEHAWLVSLKKQAERFIKTSDNRFEVYHMTALYEYVLPNAIAQFEPEAS